VSLPVAEGANETNKQKTIPALKQPNAMALTEHFTNTLSRPEGPALFFDLIILEDDGDRRVPALVRVRRLRTAYNGNGLGL